jgi:REP element-mobilizing transposase RayT
MANSFTQVNIHAVFAVYGRENVLRKNTRLKIFEYTTGLMRGLGLFPLAANGFTDHMHIFFELPPTLSLSKVIQEIKANSSRWINQQKLVPGKFQWQEGYGAFSYSKSQRDEVINYIMNQEKHHEKAPFRVEYQKLLDRYDIDYNPVYLFDFYD